MEFVNSVREKVEEMGYERKAYFTRVRPIFMDGRMMIRADCYPHLTEPSGSL
jgi:hypothetical protein